jgi:hypothetical protein
MKRVLPFLVGHLNPAWWRRRYGREFEALPGGFGIPMARCLGSFSGEQCKCRVSNWTFGGQSWCRAGSRVWRFQPPQHFSALAIRVKGHPKIPAGVQRRSRRIGVDPVDLSPALSMSGTSTLGNVGQRQWTCHRANAPRDPGSSVGFRPNGGSIHRPRPIRGPASHQNVGCGSKASKWSIHRKTSACG